MKKFKTITWYCEDCKWVWEVLSVINEDDTLEEQCPDCRSNNTKQTISARS